MEADASRPRPPQCVQRVGHELHAGASSPRRSGLHVPDFRIDYEVDPVRQAHRRLLARLGRRSPPRGTEWGWQPEWDLEVDDPRHAREASLSQKAGSPDETPTGGSPCLTDRMRASLAEQLAELEREGRRKGAETVVDRSAARPRASAGRASGSLAKGSAFLRMNSNGYLGMALRAEVIAPRRRRRERFGVGPSGGALHQRHLRASTRRARTSGSPPSTGARRR